MRIKEITESSRTEHKGYYHDGKRFDTKEEYEAHKDGKETDVKETDTEDTGGRTSWSTGKGKWANSFKGGFDSQSAAEEHYRNQTRRNKDDD